MELFQPDTCIVKCKERAVNFYYVVSGNLQMTDADENDIREVKRGDAFGCEGVFCDLPQYYSVWSKTLVKALVIGIVSIKTICSQYQGDQRLVFANLLAYFEGIKPYDATESWEIVDTTTRVSRAMMLLVALLLPPLQLCFGNLCSSPLPLSISL